jgi:hypothetical protein
MTLPSKDNYERGAVMLETAIALVPFLIFLLGTIQICLLFYGTSTLKYHSDSALRESIVTTAYPNKYLDLKNNLITNLNRFGIYEGTIQVNMCSGAVKNCNLQDPGSSGSLVTLKATATVPSLFHPGGYLITNYSVARNESF